MAQPTDLPTWATSATGLAATTAPTVGKQSDGWAPSEKPPAQYFNFWMNRVGQWCSYLKNLAGEAITWTAAHTFSVKATFAAGLASGVAPAVATDVVRKTELDAINSASVHLTGAEAVAGVKTFSSSPVVPTPAGATDAASKGYVDGKFPAVAWLAISPNGTNWTDGTAGGQTGYWKDAAGVIHLKGQLTSTATTSQTIGTLPVGYRPAATRSFAVANNTDVTSPLVTVDSAGVVSFQSTVFQNKLYRLDGVSFVAEQ